MEASLGLARDLGGSGESIGMTLAAGDVETEVATSCSQEGLPVEEGGHQSIHKSLWPKNLSCEQICYAIHSNRVLE